MESNEQLNPHATDPSHRVKICQITDDKISSIKPITIPQLFADIVAEFPSQPALVQKNLTTNEWETTTFEEYKQKVEKIAKIFIKLGLKRHGCVAVLAHNSVEWFVSGLAAIHAGGLITGIYLSNSTASVQHVLENSKANIVVVDEQSQLDKILQIRHKLPNLKAIIQTLPQDPATPPTDPQIYHWTDLDSIDTTEYDIEYQNRLSSIVPNESCNIVYTSGTTGNPKGALLSHDNITWLVRCAQESIPVIQRGCEVIVSYLPLAHVAGQCTDMYLTMSVGATIYFADKNALKGTLINTLKIARPTLFAGVPRVYEKFQEKMMQIGAQSGVVKRLVAKWAKSVTLDYYLRCMTGDPGISLQYQLARSLILGKIKEAIGFDRIKMLVVGAAPADIETKKYFCSLDMPLVDLYGMTECTLVHCMSRPDYPNMESVGPSLPGTQLKISNPDENGQGEVCLKGRNIFMGYNNDPQKTLETFDDDGWLKTGDLGYTDDNGYLYLTGRIKELVITAGGENIPPVHIENLVKAECPAISNAMLIGDKRKYLTILITLKQEVDKDGNLLDDLTVESVKFMENLGLNYKKLSEVLDGPDETVTKAINDAIASANKNAISNAQKVQKFAFLPHDFSLPTGELGPTMKIKRHFVINKYKDIIDKMYAEN
ncbi:very long-chain-fatty-acid--CoA ligase bubblegum-like [Chironomus tepperi]|uniref:very long-chain-fatty-acid--CoA ligase bubblegum-like n=1 Tax=Chironomus tepperi TaxID=113505 RepID=UPI00391EF829